MTWFQKRERVFQAQDRAGWLAARDALKQAGIPGVRAGRYDVEPPVCGCGSKLDPRDFGPRGPIDRSMYFIEVPTAEAERAKALLQARFSSK